jgi:hypothetical protein
MYSCINVTSVVRSAGLKLFRSFRICEKREVEIIKNSNEYLFFLEKTKGKKLLNRRAYSLSILNE